MIYATWIARLGDGMLLSASSAEDKKSVDKLVDYQTQAKKLFRKFDHCSLPRVTIETTGDCCFHCIIQHNVCYLALCEKTYSKRFAYSYLEYLANEFHSQYGNSVMNVSRPYSFLEFDKYMKKARNSFTDSRLWKDLVKLNSSCNEVQTILNQNIDDVLERGTLISNLENKAQNLSILSKKYRKDAMNLNYQSTNAKICLVILIIILIWFFWRL